LRKKSFCFYLRFKAVGKDGSKGGFKVDRFAESENIVASGAMNLRQNCVGFTNPCFNLTVLSSFTGKIPHGT